MFLIQTDSNGWCWYDYVPWCFGCFWACVLYSSGQAPKSQSSFGIPKFTSKNQIRFFGLLLYIAVSPPKNIDYINLLWIFASHFTKKILLQLIIVSAWLIIHPPCCEETQVQENCGFNAQCNPLFFVSVSKKHNSEEWNQSTPYEHSVHSATPVDD